MFCVPAYGAVNYLLRRYRVPCCFHSLKYKHNTVSSSYKKITRFRLARDGNGFRGTTLFRANGLRALCKILAFPGAYPSLLTASTRSASTEVFPFRADRSAASSPDRIDRLTPNDGSLMPAKSGYCSASQRLSYSDIVLIISCFLNFVKHFSQNFCDVLLHKPFRRRPPQPIRNSRSASPTALQMKRPRYCRYRKRSA